MFSFFEKNVEKRLLSDYLKGVGLSLNDLSPAISKQIIDIVHKQVCVVAKKFHEPAVTVSKNIVSSAAWGTIYCLLGPSRLLEMDSGFRDLIEEVEMELLMPDSERDAQHNIYQQVFAILLNSSHCHPEVKAVVERERWISTQNETAANRRISAMH
ncbi:MAG: hypothetical protein KZQ99_07945 [Candidatus Thiodiazotropha sp. (ex Dulcina madagascariensis)]|nr:hypothetical protein [Candidatus Thiodiazotropha sp. (ex Dulcina madagascariensis)]